MLLDFAVAECDRVIDERGGITTREVHLTTRQILEAAKSHCKHINSNLLKLITINGGVQYRRFCFDCGYKSSSIAYTKLTEEERKSAIIDDGTYNNIYGDDIHGPQDEEDDRPVHIKYTARQLAIKVRDRMRERGISFDYYAHLDSDKWRIDQRQRIFELDLGMCQICHKAKARQVHHLSYLNTGNESDDELIAICRDCHSKVTERIGYTGRVAESYKIVNEGKLYSTAHRKSAHYEALKRRLSELDLTPEDYQRRVTELARAINL